jgi:hypothetical protein
MRSNAWRSRVSDEELKEIEHGEMEHQREHDAAGATLESCHTMGCHPQLGPIPVLLAEVKRLRSLMRGQTLTSESGWQSVADGAKPVEGDYHVQFLTNPRDDGFPGSMSCMVGVYGFDGTFLSGCTHFLVIPPPPPLEEYKHRIDEFRQRHDPPPIKRES